MEKVGEFFVVTKKNLNRKLPFARLYILIMLALGCQNQAAAYSAKFGASLKLAFLE